MLEIANVGVSFGGLIAVNDFSMTVEKGTIHALIGPNGAGKTTLFNSITRVGPRTYGKVYYKGENITALPDYQMIHKGIARTFQNLHLFNGMTVYENLYAGYAYHYQKMFPSIFFGGHKKFIEEVNAKILEVAAEVGIYPYLSQFPSQLSYGILKKVEIARAIISRPEMLLLDEPAAGLNHQETEELDVVLTDMKKQGMTILLVEHDMDIVMKISDRITVINFGKKIAEGTPAEIARDPEVIRVYLGGDNNA
ncbi:ABC transporter ATP-binding protein [Alkalispirochaeta sphaeroplastigenens]|uniref:ABC transporter ATP-binding protein n=1 Tax=Alkalispirochaeta sphaeroplastigenens TaxID=1187066 RepID=A0A2S4JVL0_9SPIO|nr:ABC transporter ATP-binding protein [Alkalispirochaeta sphaeroplastigenens]POR03565.1 ABC transporter ATP-binding protein [Alkalispirochaeta sphaeroplastigenens]